MIQWLLQRILQNSTKRLASVQARKMGTFSEFSQPRESHPDSSISCISSTKPLPCSQMARTCGWFCKLGTSPEPCWSIFNRFRLHFWTLIFCKINIGKTLILQNDTSIRSKPYKAGAFPKLEWFSTRDTTDGTEEPFQPHELFQGDHVHGQPCESRPW